MSTEIIDVDAEKILSDELDVAEKYAGEPLFPGDERRMFVESEAMIHTLLYNTINDAAKQSMLKYARGEVLDAIGERLGVERLKGSPSTCAVRFSVQAPIEQDIVIPKYTKIKTDGDIYFATVENCTIASGALAVETKVESTGKGSRYNGFSVGSINKLVDLIGYVSSVTNVTVTEGGDDGEPYTTDGDDKYRERIRLAPYKLTTAGPRDSYIYWAKTADPDLLDVKAVSDVETVRKTLPVNHGKAYIGGSHIVDGSITCSSDFALSAEDDLYTLAVDEKLESVDVTYKRTLEGHVLIIPLMKGGTLPDEATKEKIRKAVSAQDVRPMTDYVEVKSPRVVNYDIKIKYFTAPDVESDVTDAIEKTGGAIDAYIDWQNGAIGRDINPDALRQQILTKTWETGKVTGAVRVDIESPVFTEVLDTEVAQFSGKLSVTHENMSGVI